ncbi:protein MAIN-LIKE 1-like [Glycine soja]|uniref:protein MAIN-LIKE 1-like n=1 Tax=Glycine soja TaxID=3848 RepID=UPI00103D8613|nr:protein MAIN-LIKE 1-like [Glycine soja]
MAPADVEDTRANILADTGAQIAEDEHEGFPGGPSDLSVLTQYADHVACSIWTEEECPELKLSSHGRKVHSLGRLVPAIEGLVAGTGLSPLIACSVDTDNRGLLSSFVEQRNQETSSFHLPMGELTITLDDVSSILHLPVVGDLHAFQPLHVDDAVQMLGDLLMVSVEDARAETGKCRGSYCWIYEHFPSVAESTTDRDYDEDSPRACRWIAMKKTVKSKRTVAYRERLNRLRIRDEVCHEIAERLERHLSLEVVTPGSSTHEVIEECLKMARSVTHDQLVYVRSRRKRRTD